jgi:hypothetical protein
MSTVRNGQETEMAVKIKLTYTDGRKDELIPGARARIDTERHYQGLGAHNVQEATFYMAWSHLKRAGSVTEEFEPWVDTVADVEETKADDPVPTQPAQPAGTSSD